MLYTKTLPFVQVLPRQTCLSFLCIREPKIKQKCQWKVYIKGFLYMSLECPQFCIVRPFHTQTSRIAHTHTQPTLSHTLREKSSDLVHRALNTRLYFGVKFQFKLHLHKMCMVMDDEVKYPL